MDSSKRIVHCEDAIEWLKNQGTLTGCSLITSMPDFSEFSSLTPPMDLEQWKAWFTRAAELVLSRCPDEGVVIFYQTDIKKDGVWVDKGYLCQKAAESLGHSLLWNKVVCRTPPGSVTYGRPSYSHMLCFSRGVRAEVSKSTCDVLPRAGETTWTRGMGLEACLLACRFVLEGTLTRTVVDPFCGHGSILAVANHLGLDAIGVELSRKRAKKARGLSMEDLRTTGSKGDAALETESPLEIETKKEIEISFGTLFAKVSPHGASLRRLYRHEGGVSREILWGYEGTENKKGGQGDILVPFPGRVGSGKYSFEGERHIMKQNDKDGPNAIHGFLRAVHWEVPEKQEHKVRFQRRIETHEFEGYPFELLVEVVYEVGVAGLECRFKISNLGSGPAPVGAGFHPYFTVGTDWVDGAELKFSARTQLELNPGLLPTGRLLPIEGTALDFSGKKRIGDLMFNHCFANLERDSSGIARITLKNPVTLNAVTLWMDESFPYLVLYTGDTIPAPNARRALAIEPMTCATDAFNRPEWGLRSLKPGESLSGVFGVTDQG